MQTLIVFKILIAVAVLSVIIGFLLVNKRLVEFLDRRKKWKKQVREEKARMESRKVEIEKSRWAGDVELPSSYRDATVSSCFINTSTSSYL